MEMLQIECALLCLMCRGHETVSSTERIKEDIAYPGPVVSTHDIGHEIY